MVFFEAIMSILNVICRVTVLTSPSMLLEQATDIFHSVISKLAFRASRFSFVSSAISFSVGLAFLRSLQYTGCMYILLWSLFLSGGSYIDLSAFVVLQKSSSRGYCFVY